MIKTVTYFEGALVAGTFVRSYATAFEGGNADGSYTALAQRRFRRSNRTIMIDLQDMNAPWRADLTDVANVYYLPASGGHVEIIAFGE